MGKDKRVTNKRASYEYEIEEKIEAGIVLEGREVKSIRQGQGSLTGAFVRIMGGEAYLINANIPGYKFADLSDYEPTRTRKLLMHKKEIESLEQKIISGNRVLVPLEIRPVGRVFKLVVGLGRGKKQYQKKEALKKRDLEREARRSLKQSGRQGGDAR